MKDKTDMLQQSTKTLANREGKYISLTVAKEEESQKILKAKRIIDDTANEIFLSHKKNLLSEPITYIIPAIWGEMKDGNLTSAQKEITEKIEPVISRLMRLFEFENLNKAQKFAVGYLIRGLIISKITYMIEALKNQKNGEDSLEAQKY
jgi:hypothetical protein